MKAEKWLFECQNLEEKYESVTKEKEVKLWAHCPCRALPCPACPPHPGSEISSQTSRGPVCTLSIQRLMAERDSLREANEELRCAQLQNRGLAQAGEFLGSPIARDLEEGVGKARSWGGSRPAWVLDVVPWSLFLTVFFQGLHWIPPRPLQKTWRRRFCLQS